MPFVQAAASQGGGSSRLVLLVTSDLLGGGPEELGRILMRSFLKTAGELAPPPWRILFLNNGVKLCLEKSPLLEDLHGLEQAGVELLACGTCLDYFQVRDALRAGRVSNMREILESLASADRVVRP